MSDAARKNLKISREGIVLIKSFEGFRPRAIQRAEGGWIIGYGHTLSAREGATVSEADAELLLRYDLLPAEKSVNETLPGDLNQHQFDALVSFAFSVGVDRFAASDVRRRLDAGAVGEAADAILGWPEPALPETALRRRAAERALFVADPSGPVALSDLLAAPLPPPAVPVPPEAAPEPEPAPSPVAAEPVAEQADAPEDITAPEPKPTPEVVAGTEDSRGAAVAALLGEPNAIETQAPPIVPVFGAPEPRQAPAELQAEPETPAPEPVAEAEAEAEAVETIVIVPDETPELQDKTNEPQDQTTEPESVALQAEPADEDQPATPTRASTPAPLAASARYAPYAAVMVGPLPFLKSAPPPVQFAASSVAAAVIEPVPTEIPQPEPAPLVPAEPAAVEAAPTQPLPAAPAMLEEASRILAPAFASTDIPAAAPVEPLIYQPPAPSSFAEPVAAPSPAELVLTPMDNSPEVALSRPLWTAEERDASEGTEANLFGEEPALTQGGVIQRNDIEIQAPARFDWSETGPFVFMGGVGLVSFGASMAAFRRAAEHSGGGDLTIIGWVLALIGLGCVGVSSVNLYRRFGLPGAD